MVNVRLDQDWTDGDGVSHAAGETVDVDPGTLARLESSGIVASAEGIDELDVEPMTIGPSRVAGTPELGDPEGDGTIGPSSPPPDEDDDGGDGDGSISLGRGVVADP